MTFIVLAHFGMLLNKTWLEIFVEEISKNYYKKPEKNKKPIKVVEFERQTELTHGNDYWIKNCNYDKTVLFLEK